MELANELLIWICSVNEEDWWDSTVFERDTFVSKISSGILGTSKLGNCCRSYDKLLTFVSPKEDNLEALDINKKCTEWKAVSYGNNYKLGWSYSSKIGHNYEGLNLIVNSFNDVTPPSPHKK